MRIELKAERAPDVAGKPAWYGTITTYGFDKPPLTLKAAKAVNRAGRPIVYADEKAAVTGALLLIAGYLKG